MASNNDATTKEQINFPELNLKRIPLKGDMPLLSEDVDSLLLRVFGIIEEIAEQKAAEIMAQHLEDYEHKEKPSDPAYGREGPRKRP